LTSIVPVLPCLLVMVCILAKGMAGGASLELGMRPVLSLVE
jgi:hypothetical protein